MTSHPPKPAWISFHSTRRVIAVLVIVDLLIMVPAIFLLNSFDLPSFKNSLATLGDANLKFTLVAIAIGFSAFTPMVAISLRNRSKGSRDYWTSNLAEKYSPKDFSMARRGGGRVTVFNLDDQEIAVSYSMFPKWGRRVEINDHCYQISFEKAFDRERPFGHPQEQVFSRVFSVNNDGILEPIPLLVYRSGILPSESHWVQVANLMDLELRPDASQSFPNDFDIIIDGEVHGRVSHAGKWTSQGVVVVLPEFPQSLRTLLALLCYENLIGK